MWWCIPIYWIVTYTVPFSRSVSLAFPTGRAPLSQNYYSIKPFHWEEEGKKGVSVWLPCDLPLQARAHWLNMHLRIRCRQKIMDKSLSDDSNDTLRGFWLGKKACEREIIPVGEVRGWRWRTPEVTMEFSSTEGGGYCFGLAALWGRATKGR